MLLGECTTSIIVQRQIWYKLELQNLWITKLIILKIKDRFFIELTQSFKYNLYVRYEYFDKKNKLSLLYNFIVQNKNFPQNFFYEFRINNYYTLVDIIKVK